MRPITAERTAAIRTGHGVKTQGDAWLLGSIEGSDYYCMFHCVLQWPLAIVYPHKRKPGRTPFVSCKNENKKNGEGGGSAERKKHTFVYIQKAIIARCTTRVHTVARLTLCEKKKIHTKKHSTHNTHLSLEHFHLASELSTFRFERRYLHRRPAQFGVSFGSNLGQFWV